MMYKLIILIDIVIAATAIAKQYSPFLNPYSDDITYNGFVLDLFRREDGCGSGISCATMGDKASCCKKKTQCAVDQAGQVACCPENAECTGTIASGAVIATATTKGSSQTNSASHAQVTSNGGGKLVSNAYYPFPYLPTKYPNANVCTSSYSSCQEEFAKCTYTLESGDNGITISGAGVGITTHAAIAEVTAASICSSRRSRCRFSILKSGMP